MGKLPTHDLLNDHLKAGRFVSIVERWRRNGAKRRRREASRDMILIPCFRRYLDVPISPISSRKVLAIGKGLGREQRLDLRLLEYGPLSIVSPPIVENESQKINRFEE